MYPVALYAEMLWDCNAEFDHLPGLIDRKIRKSTHNYLHEAAMSQEEMERAIEIGAEMVQQAYQEGSNIISFGELGIANISPTINTSCLIIEKRTVVLSIIY